MLISRHARRTRFDMMISGTGGAVQLDFFHGFALRHDSRVSRFRKAARPFGVALKQFGAPSGNFVNRGLRGGVAYPGLLSPTRAFYAPVRGESPSPISSQHI